MIGGWCWGQDVFFQVSRERSTKVGSPAVCLSLRVSEGSKVVEQPKSDRTSVTISKRVHQDFKVYAARAGMTQRLLLEFIITEYLRRYPQSERGSRKEK